MRLNFLSLSRTDFIGIASCLLLIGVIFELVRRRRIKERYSLLWFFTGISLFALVIRKQWLGAFSEAIGVYYAPSAFFLVLSGFVFLMLIHFSTVISQLLTENQKLAQKLALLEAEVRDGGHSKSEKVRDCLSVVSSRSDPAEGS
ncbi:MAG: DUF2304 domain-containing protein [Oligoflexia bacterium]|nr:DUF2304 domain-containing protein [Oligoflexia bacterium]